mmetsp:Transcript_22182/g.34011  ORF Transcript_22182/g.34011 Transcript_22182/m.34011 type:complete len:87 (+) Transcript_22182:386-646(+)|eukprot:scaffold8708_cov157-Skeletonema_marinoi.AAC.6
MSWQNAQQHRLRLIGRGNYRWQRARRIECITMCSSRMSRALTLSKKDDIVGSHGLSSDRLMGKMPNHHTLADDDATYNSTWVPGPA